MKRKILGFLYGIGVPRTRGEWVAFCFFIIGMTIARVVDLSHHLVGVGLTVYVAMVYGCYLGRKLYERDGEE